MKSLSSWELWKNDFIDFFTIYRLPASFSLLNYKSKLNREFSDAKKLYNNESLIWKMQNNTKMKVLLLQNSNMHQNTKFVQLIKLGSCRLLLF